MNINLGETTTPSTPQSTRHRLYVGTDGELKKIDDLGNITSYPSVYPKITRQTVNFTINDQFYQWNGNTDGGNLTCDLPAGVQNRAHRIVNTGTSGNTLTITPNGLEKLLGVNSSFILTDGQILIIGYDEVDGWY